MVMHILEKDQILYNIPFCTMTQRCLGERWVHQRNCREFFYFSNYPRNHMTVYRWRTVRMPQFFCQFRTFLCYFSYSKTSCEKLVLIYIPFLFHAWWVFYYQLQKISLLIHYLAIFLFLNILIIMLLKVCSQPQWVLVAVVGLSLGLLLLLGLSCCCCVACCCLATAKRIFRRILG